MYNLIRGISSRYEKWLSARTYIWMPSDIGVIFISVQACQPRFQTLVVFGANEYFFFLGHGRRHAFRGVPGHFATHVQGVDLPITQTGWISFDSTGTKYIAKNDNRNQHGRLMAADVLGHTSHQENFMA
ncbi:hypothetical protein C8R44DRAFT_725230 [Mycena epipterygia]|nr:hypothetical protein C8R44DRAFT_725230 [Mycena epipterygia]